MIKTRCFRCGHAWTLFEQNIANALAAEGVSGKPTHYVVECPHCRHINKISLKGVRLPAPQVPAEPPQEA